MTKSCKDDLIFSGVSSNVNLRFEEQLRSSYTLNQYNSIETDVKNYRENSNNNFEQKTRNRKDINEVAKEKARIHISVDIK